MRQDLDHRLADLGHDKVLEAASEKGGRRFLLTQGGRLLSEPIP